MINHATISSSMFQDLCASWLLSLSFWIKIMVFSMNATSKISISLMQGKRIWIRFRFICPANCYQR